MKRLLCWLSNNLFFKGDIERLNIRINELEKELVVMREKNKKLIDESDIINQKVQNFDFVSSALSAKNEESKYNYIREFKSLIDNDFEKDLCNAIHGVNHAETLKKVNNVYREMQLIAQCPVLHSRNIGAVGGGFSSGKSSFINSFIDNNNMKLSEGINPVTVIPSYVLCDQSSHINGISDKGGLFDISLDMYSNLSHEYVKKSFSFDLNQIISYTIVRTSMKDEYFRNLCLIDTPGYNPPTVRSAKHDFENAQRYIKYAKFLIWIVGLDANGTFPKSDIDFIRNLDSFGIKPEYPLYVVANKPQLKKAEDIEDILDSFAETLDDNDILYEGISAYDTKTKKQYSSRKKDIYSFLLENNKPGTRSPELKGYLYEVYMQYLIPIRNKHENDLINIRKVKGIMLDALESGNISIDNDASSKMEDKLNSLLDYFKLEENYENNYKKVTTIRDNFLSCFGKFCNEVGIDFVKSYFCEKCGEVLAGYSATCNNCFGESYKTCKKCKKEFPKKALFCTECGSPLK